jgi:hypothetical protein
MSHILCKQDCCDHSSDINSGIRTKQKAVGVHQKEIGGSEPIWSVGLNHSKDSRRRLYTLGHVSYLTATTSSSPNMSVLFIWLGWYVALKVFLVYLVGMISQPEN